MATCPQCGRGSPDDFTFCPACGAALGTETAAREVRKVVTILFCDLTGSTALGDRTDPEAMRTLMNRYYEAARTTLERHGGTVEKFVGDAVMAVFGIPVASEDDALRATRAAVELRDVVRGLGLEARIGLNTGEVVAGAGDTLVTGDAVNVAARLEQGAGAGEILLGGTTAGLVRDAVDVEAVELVAKGKPQPIVGHRLLGLDVSSVGVARHLDRPMLGRERERERLRADFEDALGARTCRLFTLIGPAGVGKSRLVADLLESVGDTAAVARGRALSYGEGITYWPLVEVLIQLGLDPDEAIRSSPADTQLATRALLERTARAKPLVVVLDDLQWAEPPLLDLVEHVADWSRESPIFLLCVARPELLEVRPGWGGGKLNATSVLLEPLREADAAALADLLLDGVELDAGVRERILHTAEGNPLFLEEIAALARDAGGAVEVPPTIQALIQARLDSLGEQDRTVIERGAIEGKVFHRGAVTALIDVTHDVPTRLQSLVRKELIRPDTTQIPGDEAYRFRHLLVRDAAYDSLPKAVRAELHERFAAWVDDHAELLERDEIVGYHLEQAALSLRALDPDDARVHELGRRAAERLGAAGRGALEREDLHAARSLLSRAVELLPRGPKRRGLLPLLVVAIFEAGGEPPPTLLDELETGSEHDRAAAAACRTLVEPVLAPLDDVTATLETARELLVLDGNAIGAILCDAALGWRFWGACRAVDAHRAYRRAFDEAVRSGTTFMRRRHMSHMVMTAVHAGIHREDVARLIDELYPEAVAAGPLAAASARAARTRSEFAAGAVGPEEVRAAIAEEVALLEQTGSHLGAAFSAHFVDVVVPELLGDLVGAERGARKRVEQEDAAARAAFRANDLAVWALTLCALGDGHRALEAVRQGRPVAHPDDVSDQIELDLAEAYALAIEGEDARARALVERARQTSVGMQMVLIADQIDEVDAAVRRLRGEVDGARGLLGELVRRSDERGALRRAERYRRALAALDA